MILFALYGIERQLSELNKILMTEFELTKTP